MERCEQALVAGPLEQIGSLIETLVGAYPTTGADQHRLMAFRMAIDDLPAWAVEAGIRKWFRGEDGVGTENYSFAPSPPQLRRLALRAKNAAEGRILLLRRLLAAKVVDEAASALVDPRKVQAVLGNLSGKLGSDVDVFGEKEAHRRQAEAWLEDHQARLEATETPPEAFQDAAE